MVLANTTPSRARSASLSSSQDTAAIAAVIAIGMPSTSQTL